MSPSGYSNKGGLIMNLLRDDLGTNDPTPLRYENQFSRGVPPGEYTINLHLFRNLQGTYPVPVDVTVRCSADNKGRAQRRQHQGAAQQGGRGSDGAPLPPG